MVLNNFRNFIFLHEKLVTQAFRLFFENQADMNLLQYEKMKSASSELITHDTEIKNDYALFE